MNGTKMTKIFFFQMIEKRLNELTKEVDRLKAKEDLSFEESAYTMMTTARVMTALCRETKNTAQRRKYDRSNKRSF